MSGTLNPTNVMIEPFLKPWNFPFKAVYFFLFMYWIQSILFTTGLKGNQTTIKGRMILGWSFYAIGRLRLTIESCQSIPPAYGNVEHRGSRP